MVEITYRGRKRILWAVCVTAALGIAACVYCAAALPPRVDADEHAAAGNAASHPEDALPDVGPLSEYHAVYGRDLRKPLYDPEPAAVVVKPKPERPLKLKLVGTAVDAGSTYGVFVDERGRTCLAGVGETVAEAEILSISDRLAKVKFDGREIDLAVPGERGRP